MAEFSVRVDADTSAKECRLAVGGEVDIDTADRLAQADFVLTMTRSHLFALEQLFPSLGPQPRLLDSAGDDIADPIGGSHDVYEDCARQIICHLERFLTEVPLS